MADRVMPDPIHYVEPRPYFNDFGHWASAICRYCENWTVGLLTDLPPKSGPTVTETQLGLDALCYEALAEHVAECGPDLSSRTDVERWLADG